ncbi:hypothetical protein H2248_008144 [Termitomyces sp. 'cryptogamus']|nr:hypothetical protein H2248_008144 [Termitomyces sp. 'cryptogamus']
MQIRWIKKTETLSDGRYGQKCAPLVNLEKSWSSFNHADLRKSRGIHSGGRGREIALRVLAIIHNSCQVRNQQPDLYVPCGEGLSFFHRVADDVFVRESLSGLSGSMVCLILPLLSIYPWPNRAKIIFAQQYLKDLYT